MTGGNSIALGLWRPQLGLLAGLNQTRSRACLRSADQTCRETYIRAYIHASQGATTGAHRRGYKGTERRRESACTCSRMQMQMHSLLCTHIIITSVSPLDLAAQHLPAHHDEDLQAAVSFKHALRPLPEHPEDARLGCGLTTYGLPHHHPTRRPRSSYCIVRTLTLTLTRHTHTHTH